MRKIDSCLLCFSLFKKEFTFHSLTLFVGLLLVGIIVTATELYRSEITVNFANKQPHFTIQHNSKMNWRTDTNKLNHFMNQLESTEGVMAVSPYVKSVRWGQFQATTSELENPHKASYDKFSSGFITVIGVNQASPSIVSWEALSFYTAGRYKTRISNLEFEYDWITNPNLVVPNAVFDASFYPPISQEARIQNGLSNHPWQIKGFIQDHSDQARVYVARPLFEQWLSLQDSVTEEGFFIRMDEGYSLETMRNSLDNLCHNELGLCTVHAWIDSNEKKSRILNVFETFSWSFIVIIFVLVFMLVTLYQAKSIVEKSKTINILQVTGYRFTPTIVSIVVASTMVVYVSFYYCLRLFFPILTQWLSSDVSISPVVIAVTVCLCLMSSLFSISIFNYAIRRV